MDIKMSFWNYQSFCSYGEGKKHETSLLDDMPLRQAVHEWKELGFNYPMSFVYYGEEPETCGRKKIEKGQRKADVTEMLDLCRLHGMKVILNDKRVNMSTLTAKGEEEFRKGVKRSVKDFGSHPAVYAYYIGDEPGNEESLAAAETASRIVKEYAPRLETYLNHLPVALDPAIQPSESFMLAGGYERYVDNAKTKILGYDNYAALAVYDKEKYLDDWFANLKILGDAARRKSVELFVCPNCTGFDCIRTPSEDDVRWLISAHVASGATGLVWFKLYQDTYYAGTWEGAPYDNKFNKTPTYDILRRQIPRFMENQGAVLKNYDFVWSKHKYKCYGGFEEFTGDDGLTDITCEINEVPLIVTKLKHKDGYSGYAIVNNSQTERTYVKAVFINAKGEPKTIKRWLLPGQMALQLFENGEPWLF